MAVRSTRFWLKVTTNLGETIGYTVPNDRTALIKRVTAVPAAGAATTITFYIGATFASSSAVARYTVSGTGLDVEVWWAMLNGESIFMAVGATCIVSGHGALLAGDPS